MSAMERYEEGRCIGRGNYGSAHVIRDKKTSRKFVVKKIPVELLSDSEREAVQQVRMPPAHARIPLLLARAVLKHATWCGQVGRRVLQRQVLRFTPRVCVVPDSFPSTATALLRLHFFRRR